MSIDSTYVHIFLFYVNNISQIQENKMLVVIKIQQFPGVLVGFVLRDL